MDNNGEFPIEGDKLPQELMWQKQEELWLQDFFRNNSTALAQRDTLYQERAATNISAMQTLSEPVGGSTSAPKAIEIKVELRGRPTNKKTQYKFCVYPTDKVSVLTALLVNKKAQLPQHYLFATDAAVLNEHKSFLDQGMVGVGVPKLSVLDYVSNF